MAKPHEDRGTMPGTKVPPRTPKVRCSISAAIGWSEDSGLAAVMGPVQSQPAPQTVRARSSAVQNRVSPSNTGSSNVTCACMRLTTNGHLLKLAPLNSQLATLLLKVGESEALFYEPQYETAPSINRNKPRNGIWI